MLRELFTQTPHYLAGGRGYLFKLETRSPTRLEDEMGVR